jgi:hypothetical protein
MKNNKNIIKKLLFALFMLTNLLFVSAINTGVSYADKAADFCDEIVPVSNADTAARNAECKRNARAAEAQCIDSNGTSSTGFQCIENYYAGITGTSTPPSSTGAQTMAFLETNWPMGSVRRQNSTLETVELLE